MTASRYEHGLPGDPAMAGFGAALDPAEIGYHLRELFDRASLEFQCCVLDRFRYRRGERLVVVYRIAAIHRHTGEAKSLIVSGRIHAGRSTRPERIENAGAGGLPRVVFLHGLGMRLEIFPEDRRLPNLRTYVEEPCSPDAAKLLHAAVGWAPMHAEEIDVEAVRYRPGIAATLSYCARSSRKAGLSRQCFFKLAADVEAFAAPGAAVRVNHVFERRGLPVRLSVPIVSDYGAGINVYAAAPGRSLQQLARADDPVRPDAQAAGRALASLHLVQDVDLPHANGESELGIYERASQMLAWACPEAKPAMRDIEKVAPGFLRAGIGGTVHGDMKPDHVFVSREGGEIQLIDNDSLAIGNPLLDIGCMMARLDAMQWLDGAEEKRTREICTELCGAYLDKAPASWSQYLGQARAMATLLVCQHAVHRLVPGWRGRVVAELEKAAALV